MKLRFDVRRHQWQIGVIDHGKGKPGYPGWAYIDILRADALNYIERGFDIERYEG